MCTHAYARLSDGWLDRSEIECPLHAGRFDVKTGAATAPPCVDPIKTYEIRQVGDDLGQTRLTTCTAGVPPALFIDAGEAPAVRTSAARLHVLRVPDFEIGRRRQVAEAATTVEARGVARDEQPAAQPAEARVRE